MTLESVAPALITMVAGGGGALIGSWIRSSSREAAKEQIAESLRGELATFREALFRDINGTYQRSTTCRLIEQGVQDRIGHNEDRIDDLHKYAHESKHDLNNRVFALETRRAVEERGG